MKRAQFTLAGAAAFFLVCFLLSPSFGATSIDATAAWTDWISGAESTDQVRAAVFELRLARTLMASLAGGALAVAGVVLQTLLRNGLATPFTLGVASASSFGAFLVIAFPGLAVLGASSTTGLAFLFALLCIGLVLQIARKSTRADGLLLAGVTLNFLFGAGVMLVRYLADPLRLAAMERWMLGSVESVSVAEGLFPLPWVAAGLLPILWYARDLDQLAFDEELAASRGVQVRVVRALCLLGTGLMTAAVVAWTGPIGFIGLMAPHALRPWIGLRHRILVPAAFFGGAGFLILADTLARSLEWGGRSSEVPVGIITALVGGPFFLLLLLRGGRQRVQ